MNIILITDLYGLNQSKSIKGYADYFEKNGFSASVYDACEISGVDSSSLNNEMIHQQFLSFGIDQGVNFLLNIQLEKTIIIGFSIGGLIAYKALCKGLDAEALFCVSSTRIRYESALSPKPVRAIFGSLDQYAPERQKLKKLQIEHDIILNLDHNLYDKKSVIPWLVLNVYHFMDQIYSGELKDVPFGCLCKICCKLSNMELDNAVKFQILNDKLKVVGKTREMSASDESFFQKNENIIRWVIKNRIDLSLFSVEFQVESNLVDAI